MSATSVFFGLLIALFTILLLYGMRRVKPQIAEFGSQRICPSCSLITSRFNALLGVWQVSSSGECGAIVEK